MAGFIIDHLWFAAGVGLAHVLTNLDNLAVLFAIMLSAGAVRSIVGYALSQLIVVALALAAAAGAADLLGGHRGMLGLLPMGLGLWGLISHFRRDNPDTGPQAADADVSLVGVAAMFLVLSTDSFAVLLPLLIESAPEYRPSAMIGVAGAVAIVALAALGLVRVAGRAGLWAKRVEILGPCVMILAGIYVLMDSGTDLV